MAEDNELKVADLERRVHHLERGQEDNKEAHTRMYGKIEILERENAVTSEQYRNIIKTLEDIKADIKSLKEKPARRWDLVVTALISTLVGTGVSLLLNSVGG